MLADLQKEVKKLADPEKGKFLMRFFKTGKGEYGEGDVFYGLTVPQSRKIAGKYKDLPLADIENLLQSKVHEERLIALLILVLRSKKANDMLRKEIFNFYLSHTKYINNWDLVDLSADKIVGEFFWNICHAELVSASKSTEILKRVQDDKNKLLITLAKSENLWERRIAMIATFAFIKHGEYEETFAIADILLHDKHDLIQKAVGWMLREVGKKVSEEKLEEFLLVRYKTMPRTALRYAIERFGDEKRQKYLQGGI